MTSPDQQPGVAASVRAMVAAHVFQSAVEKTRMAMAIADPNLPDCPLVYVNPAFIKMTGYSSEECVGRNCRFLQGPETDQEMVSRLRDAIKSGQVFNEELYNYRKDGSGFWNALHVSPVLDDNGTLAYFFASQIDVSARREAARRQAQRVESMGAMTSGVAHEFNNLLTVVLGSIERAAARSNDEAQARHLGRAEWASRRGGQLATELLSLARRQTSDDQVVELNAAVQDSLETLAMLAGQDVRVSRSPAPGSLHARLDSDQLQLVLMNLVRNAADAIDGAGEITIATRELSPQQASAVLNGQSAVEISVSDTGSGMPPDVRERATELFFTTKAARKGTGVGLFLALEFVDHVGGKLSIDSALGRGTTVRLAFPQVRPT